MFCKNCGANIADGEVFCPECGTKQDVAEQVVNNDVPEAAPATDNAAVVNKKSVDVKKIAIIGVVAVVLVVLIALISSLGGGKSKTPEFTLFEKNDSLYMSLLSDEESPIKISSKGASNVQYCEANGYLFYLDNWDEEGGWTLNCFNTNIKSADKAEEPEKVVKKGVLFYTVSNDGKYITYVTDDYVTYVLNFEKRDKEDRIKIAKDISNSYYDENDMLVAYAEREEDEDDDEVTYTLYSLNNKFESSKVAADLDKISYDDESNKILVFANGKVQSYADGKLNEIADFKLDEDETVGVIKIEENNNFYYTVSKADGFDVNDIITDSKKDFDANLVEPDENDKKYWKNPDAFYYWDIEYTDEYYAELEEYEKNETEKDLRDDIREYIEDGITIEGMSGRTLYYFNGKEPVVLVENVIGDIIEDDGFLTYTKAEKAADVTIDINDIAQAAIKEADKENGAPSSYYWIYSDEIARHIKDKLVTGSAKGIIVDNTACAVLTVSYADDDETINAFNMADIDVSPDGKAVYYTADFDEDTSLAKLYKMNIKSKALGEAEAVYENVYSYWFNDEGDIYSYRETEFDKDDNIEGHKLYKNNDQIAEDVRRAIGQLDSGEYLFGTDYDDKRDEYTLNMYEGKKNPVKISEDVIDEYAINSEAIYYISDYDNDDYEGVLNLWTGSKKGPFEIEDGVSEFVYFSIIEMK